MLTKKDILFSNSSKYLHRLRMNHNCEFSTYTHKFLCSEKQVFKNNHEICLKMTIITNLYAKNSPHTTCILINFHCLFRNKSDDKKYIFI